MSHQGLYEMGMLLVALPLLLFERALSKGKLKSQWEACALKTQSEKSDFVSTLRKTRPSLRDILPKVSV